MPSVRQKVGGIPVPVQQASILQQGGSFPNTHTRALTHTHCTHTLDAEPFSSSSSSSSRSSCLSGLRSVGAHAALDRAGESLQGLCALSHALFLSLKSPYEYFIRVSASTSQ